MKVNNDDDGDNNNNNNNVKNKGSDRFIELILCSKISIF